MIDVQKLKQLRELTGSPLMDCQKALTECDNNLEKAIDWLTISNKTGIAQKQGRSASEGTVMTYTHANGKVGVMIEVNCETDFAAKSECFHSFVKDMCLQIAAMAPKYISRDDVPIVVSSKVKYLLAEKAKVEKKPEKFHERIINGGMDKWYTDNCLLEQPFVKDAKGTTCGEVLNIAATRLGEKIVIKRFVRYELNDA